MPRFVILFAILLAASHAALAQPLTAPVPVEPLDRFPFYLSAQPPLTAIPLTWEDVSGEDGYIVNVDFTSPSGRTGSAAIFVTQDFETVDFTPSDLGAGQFEVGTYTWQVRAYRGEPSNPSELGPPTAARSFRVLFDVPFDPFDEAPNLYPENDDDLNCLDVLFFALRWQANVDSANYSLSADLDKDGLIQTRDLLALVNYSLADKYPFLFPEVMLVQPPVEGITVPLSDVLSGSAEIVVEWETQPAAHAYVIDILWSEEARKVVLAEGGETQSTNITEFLRTADFYNVRVAAVDKNYLRGVWSVFGIIEVQE